jgi:hypothetical protein
VRPGLSALAAPAVAADIRKEKLMALSKSFKQLQDRIADGDGAGGVNAVRAIGAEHGRDVAEVTMDRLIAAGMQEAHARAAAGDQDAQRFLRNLGL